jgi:hypothetical protein
MGYVSSLTQNTSYAYADAQYQTTLFTTAGANNWTVPAGVEYVIAHMIGGGGGTQQGATAGGTGGTSSVAFAGGTVTALGGNPYGTTDTSSTNVQTNKTGVNYGDGAMMSKFGGNLVLLTMSGRGAYVVAGGAVTPGATLVVTVGAGGTAGTGGSAGKQGVVWLEYAAGGKRRIETFKTSGTFTPPTGVSYATAYMRGGGGGGGLDGASDGGDSSVAFAGGTITAEGGSSLLTGRGTPTISVRVSGAANSGEPVRCMAATTSNYWVADGRPSDWLVASGAVTAGVGITVTVGSGGSGDAGATGGSGLVVMEYMLP